MKVFGICLVAITIACCCAAIDELVYNEVTHIIVGSGSTRAIYQWKQRTEGTAYAEACYGRRIIVYAKATSDINPKTDAPWANFSSEDKIPIQILVFTPGWYYAFYSEDTDDKGPNGINAALDIIVGTDEDNVRSMLPGIPSKIVEMKISMNAGTATLTWESTGVDNTTIYRKDVPLSDYSEAKWFPPSPYYMTACSAKYWMAVDEEATKNVKIQHPDQKYTGLVQLSGINKNTVTLVAVTTEKKVENPFTLAYDFVALGAASSTIISAMALLLLLVSVLII